MYLVVMETLIHPKLVFYAYKLIPGILDDMWMYNTTSNSWKFMSGSKVLRTKADFTTPVAGSLNRHSMVLKDDLIYVFGGQGYVSDGLGSLYISTNIRCS